MERTIRAIDRRRREPMGKRRMRRAMTALLLALALMLSGCARPIDVGSEGIVAVTTRALSGDDGAEEKGYVVAGGRRAAFCEPMAADDATVYVVPYGCFESYIDRTENKVRNRVARVAVADERGVLRDPPEIMEDLFEQIAEIRHDLLETRIFEIDGEYFVFAELNVMLWTPCALYYYNRQAGRLVELYTFDDEEVLGIRVLSAERLHAAD